MPIFNNPPMLPIGSMDAHDSYLSRFSYRYYCTVCIRNIEAEKKLEKCVYCRSAGLLLLKKKEEKEGVQWAARLSKFIQSLRETNAAKLGVRKTGEELPTR